MSEHNDDKTWFRLERNSIRAAEAKFGVGHPRHDEAALVDEATHWYGCDSVHPDCHHPAERILLDLIAELKDQVHYYPDDVFPGFTADDPASQSQTPDRIAGVAMRDAWTRAAAMADRAEARLREIGGDDADV